MTVKTTLSFTDRHHDYLARQVGQGVFATQSAGVAAAVEQMIQDEEEREVALTAIGQEIRARLATPRALFVDQDAAFSVANRTLSATRKA